MKKSILIIALFFIFSCSKKDRLQINTLELFITPSSVSVQVGGTVELSCIGKSAKSDDVDINPIWTVEPETLGTFSPTRGKKVTFTASSQPATGKIKATEGDVYKEVSLTVVQTTQTTGGGSGGGGAGSGSSGNVKIVFYDDNGLNSSFGTPDIFTWSSGGLNSSEITGGGCSLDPQKYQKFEFSGSGSNLYFGGGIVLNKVSGSPNSVDLSQYYSSTAKLKFCIKLSRSLTVNEKIKVEIEHTQQVTKSTLYLLSSYGFDSTSTDWQTISIPLSNFSSVDYTKILLPFEITAESLGSPLTFYWDYVRWEE